MLDIPPDPAAVMLVADVTKKDSISEALKWKKEIDNTVGEVYCILLINKIDSPHFIQHSELTNICIEYDILQWYLILILNNT